MTEKELILKIKKLRTVQPDREWIQLTKSQILGEAQTSFTFHSWLKNRAFLVAPALAIILVVGVFLYSNRHQIFIEQPGIAVDPAILEAVTTGLRTVELDVVKATAHLQKAKDPQRVLGAQDSISSALESGERIVAAAKKLSEKPQNQEKEAPKVMTVITGVENALEEMEKTYTEKQKELAGQLIEELENSILQDFQKELVEEAKNHYNQGNFSEALIKAIEASQGG
jgi:hypothetical protein